MNNKPTYEELLNYISELETRMCFLETKLEENREKTEKLKSKFLGNVSHELRTPMNAILGFSNLLIDKDIPHEKREEYMEHINQSSSNLLKIVDAMIDASLLELNELKIYKENFHLEKLVQQVYYFFNIDKRKIGKDNIVLLLNRDRMISDLMIYSDPYRLTQVLTSLLGNAFKFTEKGIIEFGYFLNDDEHIQFYVKDSGRGISIDKSNAIFEKFEKMEEDYGTAEGVGLGLSLSKGIVDLLGGNIWVERNMVKGTTFSFTILYKDTGKAKEDHIRYKLSGLKV